MNYELHKETTSAKDACVLLLETIKDLQGITLDQLVGGIKVDISISNLDKKGE